MTQHTTCQPSRDAKQWTVADVLELIQDHIDSAARNEQQAALDYVQAHDDVQRQNAHLVSQISIGQRLLLQSILVAVAGADHI
jgi:hypothetical protein